MVLGIVGEHCYRDGRFDVGHLRKQLNPSAQVLEVRGMQLPSEPQDEPG